MVDKLKEFIDVRGAAVPDTGALTVDIAGTDATTQNLVQNLDVTVTSPSGQQSKLLEILHKGNVLDSFSALAADDLSVNLSGNQLVDSSSAYDIRITGEPSFDTLTRNFGHQSSGNLHGLDYLSYILPPPSGSYDPTPAEFNANVDPNRTTLRTGVPTSMSDSCTYYVGDRAVVWIARGGTRNAYYVDDGTSAEGSVGTSLSGLYCIATDGTYLYTLHQSSNTNLYRTKLSDGAEDIITMSTALSVGGATYKTFEYFGGFLYLIPGGSATVQKINVVTGVVTTFSIGGAGNGQNGGVVTRTTEATPRDLLIIPNANSTTWIAVDLADDSTSTFTGPFTAGTGYYPKYCCEVAPGIIWVGRAGQSTEVVGSLNSGAWVSEAVTYNPNDFNALLVVFGTNSHLIPSADDLTYDAYATGVTIT